MDTDAKVIIFPMTGKTFSQDTLSHSAESLSHTKENPPEKIKQPLITPELLHDLDTLSKMGLRKKYSREAGSHKSRKGHCKKTGATFAPEFSEFRDFLGHVGVIPGPGKWDLDRIDNTNPNYFPGGVRWASKTTQNNNKGDNVLLTHSGITRPLTEWAEIVGQKPNTMRQRKRRGWCDAWVIYGKPQGTGKPIATDCKSWAKYIPNRPAASYEAFERLYQNTRIRTAGYGRESRPAWLASVANQFMSDLKDKLIDAEYSGDPNPEAEYQYQCWRNIRARIGRVSYRQQRRQLPRIGFAPDCIDGFANNCTTKHFAN